MLFLRRLMFSSLIVLSVVIASACTANSPADNGNQTNRNAPANSNSAASGNANVVASKPANNNASAKTPKPGRGNIEVTSVPSGAGVTLIPNDESGASLPQAYGATPVTITDLAPGTYTIQAQMNGYRSFSKDVKVTANATAKVNAILKKR